MWSHGALEVDVPGMMVVPGKLQIQEKLGACPTKGIPGSKEAQAATGLKAAGLQSSEQVNSRRGPSHSSSSLSGPKQTTFQSL